MRKARSRNSQKALPSVVDETRDGAVAVMSTRRAIVTVTARRRNGDGLHACIVLAFIGNGRAVLDVSCLWRHSGRAMGIPAMALGTWML